MKEGTERVFTVFGRINDGITAFVGLVFHVKHQSCPLMGISKKLKSLKHPVSYNSLILISWLKEGT